MPTDVTREQFVEYLGKSQLVSPEKADELYARWREEAGEAGTPQGFADWLVDRNVITAWHASKLIQGKYRGFILDRYKLLRHIGSGGMSSVYLGEHKSLGQLRAIKVLPESKVGGSSMLERFYLEARSVASLDHPNVVRVYDIAQAGTTHYIVMEYLDGKNLAQLVQERGPLPIDDAVEYMAEAARGLAYAHHTHLIHRDVKPGNLILTERNAIKLVDLGLALVKSDTDTSLTQVYNERVLGTADYLAPEQALSSHDVDGRADIYSLGCTFYFLLAGHPPFPDGSLPQRIVAHQTKAPRGIREIRPDVPTTLAGVVAKMLAKRPEDRYQSMDEVVAALEAFQKEVDPDQAVAAIPPVLRTVATPVEAPAAGTVTPPPRRASGSNIGSRSDIKLGEAETLPDGQAGTAPILAPRTPVPPRRAPGSDLRGANALAPNTPPPRGGSGIGRGGPVVGPVGPVVGPAGGVGPRGVPQSGVGPVRVAPPGAGQSGAGQPGSDVRRGGSGIGTSALGPTESGVRPVGPTSSGVGSGRAPTDVPVVGPLPIPARSRPTGGKSSPMVGNRPSGAKSSSFKQLTPMMIAWLAGGIVLVGILIAVAAVLVYLAVAT